MAKDHLAVRGLPTTPLRSPDLTQLEALVIGLRYSDRAGPADPGGVFVGRDESTALRSFLLGIAMSLRDPRCRVRWLGRVRDFAKFEELRGMNIRDRPSPMPRDGGRT